MYCDLTNCFLVHIRPAQHNRPLRWHVGSDLKGIEKVSTLVHSDTLFSAICHAWSQIFGKKDLDDCLCQFKGDNVPFRLSSLLPLGSGGNQYFLPKPCLEMPQSATPDLFLRFQKAVQNVVFVSLETLQEWLELRTISPRPDRRCEVFYRKMVQDFQSYQRLFCVGTEMGIRMDSTGMSSPNVFYRGFSGVQEQEYGYYLVLQCLNAKYLGQLKLALDEVGRAGLGGERSLGFGKFTVDKVMPLPQEWKNFFRGSATVAGYLLLSLYSPSDSERSQIDLNHARYTLVPRKGWFHSPTGYAFKRKRCQFLGEGSFVPMMSGNEPSGSLVDVSPEIWAKKCDELQDVWHAIYRYGIALGIPVYEKEAT